MRRMRLRKSTPRTCAVSSFSVKYAWPEPYRRKFEISPSTHTAGNCSSTTARNRSVSWETVRTARSATRRGPLREGEGVAHEHGDGHGADASGHGGDRMGPSAHGV